MNRSEWEHRFEFLNPIQIEAAIAKAPILYIPIGTLEWHGNHLPVGTDALKAHELCLSAVRRTGGLVLPPFYYGTAGHTGYPLTVLVREEPIIELMRATLQRMAEWGAKLAVIFTGHYSGEQMAMVKGIASAWTDARMKVLALTDYMLPNPPTIPDHAASFETSMMQGLIPGLVHLENLPDKELAPANDPDGNTWGAHRHDPNHPLYGIFGEDPRTIDATESVRLADRAAEWLSKAVLDAYKAYEGT
jgi:creatinine amidohydrolase